MPDFPDVAKADRISPHFAEEEQAKAEAHTPLSPRLIHEIIRDEGEAELRRPVSALAWSGLASGLSMGFSFLTQALLRSGLPDEPWRHLIDSFGYSVGFIIVVLGRQQLFTESTLTAVLPVLARRDRSTVMATLRLWAIVLSANLIGTFLFAAMILPDNLLRPEVYPALSELALATMASPFWVTLLKAIFAGWLIALMVWLLPSAGSARLLVILLLTYVVALGHLSHIIAGSVEAAYAVLDGQAAFGQYLMAFLLPTLIGNTIGGVSLVAFLNHAPLSAERRVPSGADSL
jgi:formate/nitrite transporter FocA (FNT family)